MLQGGSQPCSTWAPVAGTTTGRVLFEVRSRTRSTRRQRAAQYSQLDSPNDNDADSTALICFALPIALWSWGCPVVRTVWNEAARTVWASQLGGRGGWEGDRAAGRTDAWAPLNTRRWSLVVASVRAV